MPFATYPRSQIKASLNNRLHNKLAVLADPDTTINDSVREVVTLLDLRSQKRKGSPLALINTTFIYSAPADIKGYKLINLEPENGDESPAWSLVSDAEFAQKRTPGLVAFTQNGSDRKLLVACSENAATNYVPVYYSKFAWQDKNGNYKENSTADTDVLVCDTEEYNLFMEKCVEYGGQGTRDYEDSAFAAKKFLLLLDAYKQNHKSEALQLQDSYYNFN